MMVKNASVMTSETLFPILRETFQISRGGTERNRDLLSSGPTAET